MIEPSHFPKSHPPNRSSKILFGILFVLLILVTYLNSFGNAFVWDDLNNIINNRQLEKPMRLQDVFLKLPEPPARFYRPIPFLTIILDHSLWGKNVFGYHLTNFLFHLLNVLLIFFIAYRLTDSDLTSFICAALFAVHPVHTEAVTYISGRSDPICALFLFASFYFYIRYSDGVEHKKIIYLITALSLFTLGLFSKEIALIFPMVLLLYEALFIKNSLLSMLKRWVPFVALALGFLLFRHVFIGWHTTDISLSNIYLFPRILLFYIRLLVFPFNLHMHHNLKESDLLLMMPYITTIIIFAIIGILVIFNIVKDKTLVFGFGWFIVSLMPFSGILKLNSDMTEHWLYLASFGFFLMAAVFIARSRMLKSKFTLSLVILLFSILTIQRNTVWRDDISIYQDTLKYSQDDHKLHYNLGNAYLRRGMLDEASGEYLTALDIKPDYTYAMNNMRLVSSVFAGEEEQFDYSSYGEVLAKFTKDGKVDYIALKKNISSLDVFLKEASEMMPGSLNSMARNEKIAFYINIYNALTLKVITDYYPVKSIKDIPGVWDKIKFRVAGSELTLNRIEHDILRKEFKEPRIHFALVCASQSCPKLAGEPFNGKDLNKQLEKNAREFINGKAGAVIDRDNKVLYISSIFKWFGEDFGNTVQFISRYIPEEDAKFIRDVQPRVKYLRYDWSLNDK